MLLDANKISALILAKSESTRLPNKNTLDFHGEPMFLKNVRKALTIFEDVYVSSDSPDILMRSEEIGAKAILRNEDLCGDTPNIPVYKHAARKMKGDAFLAIQANSPTVNRNLIVIAKKMLWLGAEEIMTCHSDFSIYGSIWGMTFDRLNNYSDPYKPTPEILLVDSSVDIHSEQDYNKALKQSHV